MLNIKLNIDQSKEYPCCEKIENLEPIFVFQEGKLGITSFCSKCGHLFLEMTDYATYGNGAKTDVAINVFEDSKSLIPIINKLRNNVKYIVFPYDKADKNIITMVNATELKIQK